MSLFEKFINFVVEKLVRSKIKKQFGGSLKTFVSGGGALDAEIGTILNAIGYQHYKVTGCRNITSCWL